MCQIQLQCPPVQTMDGAIVTSSTTDQDPVQELMTWIEAKNLKPTHFLLTSLSLHPDVNHEIAQEIVTHFVRAINGVRMTLSLKGEESISITWKTCVSSPSTIFWAKSRLAALYVSQLTKGIIVRICKETSAHFGVEESHINCRFITAKNLGAFFGPNNPSSNN